MKLAGMLPPGISQPPGQPVAGQMPQMPQMPASPMPGPQGPAMGQQPSMGTSQMPVPPNGQSQVPTPPQPSPEEQEQHDYSKKLKAFIADVNIADHLDEVELDKIGKEAYEGYMADLRSRTAWEENLDTWTKLALQVKEVKTYPWPKASNVKFPLLSTAAMQFSARAYPALVPSDGQVVKAKVIGFDHDGSKADKADRVSKHMSYQIMEKMVDWEDDMDKLLMILPIIGTCFKKTGYDSLTKTAYSDLVLPKDLVVNYWTKSIESSERKTERIFMSKRMVQERIRSETWLDVDLAPATAKSQTNIDKDKLEQVKPAGDDESTPYLILEQHTFLELDDDGYPEPYIVTFEAESRKILRITARFDDEGVHTDDKGRIIKIDPVEYYTKYGFIPNPDGGFYDLGFGLLLGTLNESVNTIINQLVDAGTLSNMQSGFIAKGLRIKMGEARFTPGEWKSVNATADDLRKQIVPLPVNAPSNVLMELLGTLVTSAKELASIAEIFVGKMPGQNTPAGTTQATIEQGMKVFTAIYKRVYRSLDKEFKKLFRLNRIYLDPQEEIQILDQPITQSDYEDKGYDICPAADPAAVSNSEKSTKFQAVLQLMQLGTLDPTAVTKRGLVSLEIPNPEELLRQGPPPTDPKVAIEQQKAQVVMQQAQAKTQMDAQKAQVDASTKQGQAAMQVQMQDQQAQFQQAMAQLDMKSKMLDLQLQAMKGQQDLHQANMEHQQKLQQSKETHAQKLKEKPKE